jgi:hypothetical protein
MLSTSETPGVRLLRHFLGDPTIDNDTASMATNGTAQLKMKYHDRVSALLAAYRLLDLEILRLGTVPTIPTPLYPKSLTPQMVEHGKVKPTWKKLEKWQDIIINFRQSLRTGLQPVQGLVTDMPSPLRGSLAHLQGLSDSHAGQKLGTLIQNFRGAALLLTLIKETADFRNTKLPGIPESIAALVAGDQPVVNVAGLPLTKYDLHTREKMRDYLNDHSSGELSLPLHLSLLLTPLCLLMPVAHVKGKFRRPSLSEVCLHYVPVDGLSLKLFGQLSRALGNEKPEILTRVENEIWKALWMINEDSSMPVIIKAFQQLADSDVFHEVVGIHATDPAFSFFRRALFCYFFLYRYKS